MQRARSTLILLAVLLGLGAYLYFVESKRDPGAESAKEKVFTIAEDKVEELQVKAASGESSTLKKADGTWTLVEPTAVKADDAEVSGIMNNLRTLEIQRVVEENAASLQDYGLATPRFEVGYRQAGEQEVHRVLIGEKTSTGSDAYAKLPSSNRVFLVSAYASDNFNKTPFDLQDKTILKFDRDKLQGLSVESAGRVLAFERPEGGDWKVVKPYETRADYASVENLVGRISTAQMKSLVVAEARDLKEYGLDKPAILATLSMGSARASLALGKQTPEGDWYARDTSGSKVVVVPANLADELRKGLDDYRNRDLFAFRPFNAVRAQFEVGGRTLTFERTKGQGADTQDQWRRLGEPPVDVDTPKMEDLLTKVSSLRAVTFADPAAVKTGLGSPAATISVTYNENEQEKQDRVAIARVGEQVYGSRANELAPAEINAADFDAAMKVLASIP